jgi:TRAP-type C4-dicarboxylate transport system substrate-binding protein
MRRHVLGILALASGVVGGALSLGAQTPPAAATRSVTLATLAPPGSTWMRVFDAWNREVRRRSNQGLQLRIYAGGVQGDEAEVIRKIRNGRLDAGAVTAVGLGQVHRPALVYQLPGLFRTYANLDNARNALANDMHTAFETAGFELMGWADVGQTRLFTNTPVATPSQLATTRPWIWRDDAITPAFFQIVHANGVPLQVPEVLAALQTNRINAFVTSPVAAVALQWASRATHMTDTSVGVSVGATIFGRAQWNTLTPEHQTILRETATQFHALARRNLRSDEQAALQSFPQRNIQSVPVDAAQRAQWDAVFAQTRQRLTGQIADAAFIARVQQLGR